MTYTRDITSEKVTLALAQRKIDQSLSEQRLHRILYFLTFLRAQIVNLLLIAVSFLLYYTLGIKIWYSRSIIDTNNIMYFIIINICVIGILVTLYISITQIWVFMLQISSVLFCIMGAFFLFAVAYPLITFSFSRLSGYFSILASLYCMFVCVVALDTSIALWNISRSTDKYALWAMLDRRLLSGIWNFSNKVLNLPCAPLRRWRSIAGYILCLCGLLVMIASINCLLSFDGIFITLTYYFFGACKSNNVNCVMDSSSIVTEIIAWMLCSVLGLRAATFLQLAGKSTCALSVSDVLPMRSSRFILYLRAFDSDDIMLPMPKLPLLSRLFSVNPFPRKVEQELFDVCDGYRPLIAVGRPGTAGTRVGGLAYKTFLGDSDWQNYVSEQIRLAESIVILVRATSGVLWEMSSIIEHGAARKTLFLIDPAAQDVHVWDKLAKRITDLLVQYNIVLPAFSFHYHPIGFTFNDHCMMCIVNSHWSVTSYRTAFSSFLSGRLGSENDMIGCR